MSGHLRTTQVALRAAEVQRQRADEERRAGLRKFTTQLTVQAVENTA